MPFGKKRKTQPTPGHRDSRRDFGEGLLRSPALEVVKGDESGSDFLLTTRRLKSRVANGQGFGFRPTLNFGLVIFVDS